MCMPLSVTTDLGYDNSSFLLFPIITKNTNELFVILQKHASRGSAVAITTGYGLDDRGAGVRVPVGQEFSLLHVVQTGSGAHPASYPMGTGGSFLASKAAGA
jgi:hypothetical protein